jgi:hypothetical protein
LKRILSLYVNSKQNDWDECLPFALAAYRTTRHRATGHSPYFLLFGREALMPTEAMLVGEDPSQTPETIRQLHEARELAAKSIAKVGEETKKNFDKNRPVKEYKKGDKVLLHNSVVGKGKTKSLTLQQWKGPYQIIERMTVATDFYKIQHLKNVKDEQKVHVSRLKRFIEDQVEKKDKEKDKKKQTKESIQRVTLTTDSHPTDHRKEDEKEKRRKR